MTSKGKLDVDEVFRICASVGIPIRDIGDLTMAEILPYVDGYNQSQRGHYEVLEYVVAMGYASAKKGKILPLFKDEGKANSKQKVKELTKEEREAEILALSQTFGG